MKKTCYYSRKVYNKKNKEIVLKKKKIEKIGKLNQSFSMSPIQREIISLSIF